MPRFLMQRLTGRILRKYQTYFGYNKDFNPHLSFKCGFNYAKKIYFVFVKGVGFITFGRMRNRLLSQPERIVDENFL